MIMVVTAIAVTVYYHRRKFFVNIVDDFIIIYDMMATGQHNINSDALNLLFLTWPAA